MRLDLIMLLHSQRPSPVPWDMLNFSHLMSTTSVRLGDHVTRRWLASLVSPSRMMGILGLTSVFCHPDMETNINFPISVPIDPADYAIMNVDKLIHQLNRQKGFNQKE